MIVYLLSESGFFGDSKSILEVVSDIEKARHWISESRYARDVLVAEIDGPRPTSVNDTRNKNELSRKRTAILAMPQGFEDFDVVEE